MDMPPTLLCARHNDELSAYTATCVLTLYAVECPYSTSALQGINHQAPHIAPSGLPRGFLLSISYRYGNLSFYTTDSLVSTTEAFLLVRDQEANCGGWG